MCTAVAMSTSGGMAYFGRTMDFSYPLDPELYFVPKGYRWTNMLKTHSIRNQYSIMGIGQNISPVVFADAVNDQGFAAAALYFPGYADYDDNKSNVSRPSISSLELVHFLTALCASVEQATYLLNSIQIVGVQDPVTNSIAPLHWILTDRSGCCVVVEKMADGLHIMNNPIGVLTNSPDFSWHMTNLNSFMNIMPSQQKNAAWGPVSLSPFGQGAGTLGLPGDYTPPSRFVRTAFLKTHASLPSGREECVNTCFHLLDSVTIPKGVVITDRGTSDYTQYTAFIDLSSSEYFFKTYENSQIYAVPMPSMHQDIILSLGKLSRPAGFGVFFHHSA